MVVSSTLMVFNRFGHNEELCLISRAFLFAGQMKTSKGILHAI